VEIILIAQQKIATLGQVPKAAFFSPGYAEDGKSLIDFLFDK